MTSKHKIILDTVIAFAIWLCFGYYIHTLFQERLEQKRQEAVALKLIEEDRKKFAVIVKDSFYNLED